MLRRFVLAIALALSLSVSPVFAAHHAGNTAANSTLAEFPTESAAQKHCPKDTVVWLNTNSGIYHEKGMRWYGQTRAGAYVCKAEADAAGDRDTRNGQ